MSPRSAHHSSLVPSALATHVSRGLVALALLAGTTLAETYSVSPNGPLPTIQAGVDAAGPGDTVAVKAGTYLENVTIPGGKNGLQLVAQGRVVLDARPEGPSGTGPGLIVESDDVTVRGLTIRHAAAGQVLPGHGIYAAADGLRVVKTTIQHCEASGIWSESADHLTVTGVTLSGCGQAAVRLQGAFALVEKTRISRCGAGLTGVADMGVLTGNAIASVGGAGIDLVGEGVVVSRNVIERCDDEGISLLGESCRVERNTIDNSGAAAISVKSAFAHVLRNRISHADGVGVEVLGEGARITSNRVGGVSGAGIASEGTDALIDRNTLGDVGGHGIDHVGSSALITRNTVRDVRGQRDGIRLAGTFDSEVSHNRVADVTGNGIRVADGSAAVLLFANRIDDAGDDDRDGILALGQGHELVGNRIARAGRDGIHTEGEALRIEGNLVTDAGEDGIDLDSGMDCSLLDNKVTGCLAEGIENSGFGTVVEGNVAKGNRTDFADDNDMAGFSGNQSADGTHLGALKPVIDS